MKIKGKITSKSLKDADSCEGTDFTEISDADTYVVTESELNEISIKTLLNSMDIEILSSHLGVVRSDKNKFLNFLRHSNSELISAFVGYPKDDFSNKI